MLTTKQNVIDNQHFLKNIDNYQKITRQSNKNSIQNTLVNLPLLCACTHKFEYINAFSAPSVEISKEEKKRQDARTLLRIPFRKKCFAKCKKELNGRQKGE